MGAGLARARRVLVVDDEEPFRKLLERSLSRLGHEVHGAGAGPEALAWLAERDCDVVILDINLPGMSGIELLKALKRSAPDIEAIVITGHATIASAIEAMKLGAYDYIEKPLKMSELALLVERALERRRLASENDRLRQALARREPPAEIVGHSQPMRELKTLIDTYAAADSAVLILGESGTGKELVARAIHRRGPRAEGPFVAINCGALKETLLENELFGHVRGAFTGADSDRAGLFEHADAGVLFIDEVCEMGVAVQKTFLRVLEDGRVRRLGDVREREVAVRIVAATNRDVEREVREGRFREDLYYRLNVLRIELPALRERSEDIPELAKHYLEAYARRTGRVRRLTPDAVSRLRGHRWPGNVRELFNVLERALIIADDGVIGADDLPSLPPAGSAGGGVERPGGGPAGVGGAGDAVDEGTLEAIERRHIERTLEAARGNKTAAARELGISIRSLYRKLQKYGLM